MEQLQATRTPDEMGTTAAPVSLVNKVAYLREGLLTHLHRWQAGALRVPQSVLKSFKDRGRQIGATQQPSYRINAGREGIVARHRDGWPKREGDSIVRQL